jgi:hypothetical protein
MFSLTLCVALSEFMEDWRLLTLWALAVRAAPSELEFEAHGRLVSMPVLPGRRYRRLVGIECFVYLCIH